MHGLAGREVSEEDLATFLVLGGLAADAETVRRDPAWDRWAAHRMALSWQSELLDRPARSVDDLTRVSCPVLLVKGTRTADLERRVVDVLGERLTDAAVVELDGDHASHIESLDAFLEAFERHVRRVP